MADPTSELPEGPARRRRAKQAKKQRRKRLALVLVLFSILVGAGVFAPDFVRLVRRGRPNLRQVQRPAKIQRPLVRQQWRFDFSMGPILELIEQGLNLEPFDLRRPLRIPFTVRSRPGGDILLAGPASYLPPLVPARGNPLGHLPAGGGSPSLPTLTDYVATGGGIPDGQPDFDPDLTIEDDPLAPPGDPPKTKDKDPKIKSVPEPPASGLLAAALVAFGLRRRTRR